MLNISRLPKKNIKIIDVESVQSEIIIKFSLMNEKGELFWKTDFEQKL